MVIDYFDAFLTGAYVIIFLYFMTLYSFSRTEKYYLYFAIACLVEAIRISVLNIPPGAAAGTANHFFYRYLGSLTFIWFPYLQVMIANALFNGISKQSVNRFLLYFHIGISLALIFIFLPFYQYPPVIDYLMMGVMVYATYIFTVALIKRMRFSIGMFITNAVVISVAVHDVLLGSGIITSRVGELNPYMLFGYLYMVSVVLAKKHNLMNEAHFKAQMKFLHAQIEPHFLYNTISTIRACCRTDAEKSRELLEHFSVYLRGKFKNGEEIFTPLKDEIELVKAYLAIEQVRFNHRLTAEYDIDEDLDVLVPCLIIQPIVENAVKHGLYPKTEGGKITISIKRLSENIVITISDNGIGMDETQISKALSNRAGIGINNTNERLKQYYGTEIEIHCIPGEGTSVVITIPVKQTKTTDIRKRVRPI